MSPIREKVEGYQLNRLKEIRIALDAGKNLPVNHQFREIFK